MMRYRCCALALILSSVAPAAHAVGFTERTAAVLSTVVSTETLSPLPETPLTVYSTLGGISTDLRRYGRSAAARVVDEIGRLGGSLNDVRSFGTLSTLVGRIDQVGNASQVADILGRFRGLGGSYSQILSGSGNLESLFSKLQGFGNHLGDLNSFLANFKNIGGTFSGLTSGFSDFGATLTQLKGFGSKLGTLSNLFGTVGDLRGNFSQLLSGFTDMRALLSRLGSLRNLSGVADVFSRLSNLGGSFSSIVSQLGSFNGVLTKLRSLNLSTLTSGLTNFGNLGFRYTDLIGSFGGLSGALSALAGGGGVSPIVPFGGRVLVMIPCIAPPHAFYIKTGPPSNASLIYLAGTSISYLYGPPVIGRWILGIAESDINPCLISPHKKYRGGYIIFHGSSGVDGPYIPPFEPPTTIPPSATSSPVVPPGFPPAAGCGDGTTIAGWDLGLDNASEQLQSASGELKTLLACMCTKLKARGLRGTITSISDRFNYANPGACVSRSRPASCVHSVGSCHYGGGTGENKSHAVDIGRAGGSLVNPVITAARECNAGRVGDEPENAHVHVNTASCRGD